MESNRKNDNSGLASYFEGYRKSRAFNHGYSAFISALASTDNLNKPLENEPDTQNDIDTDNSDDNDGQS